MLHTVRSLKNTKIMFLLNIDICKYMCFSIIFFTKYILACILDLITSLLDL